MYNILLRGTAGPETDIAKARVYVGATMAAEVDVAPGAQFNVTLQSPGSETLQVGYSFVDGAGNESGQFAQQVVVPDPPDLTAPASPSGPMTLVSVVWVP